MQDDSHDKIHLAGHDCVILLHGLGRTRFSMMKMALQLKAAGYRVLNLGYPSRKKSISTLAEEVISKGVEECRQHPLGKIHFVTHSLGGILLRHFLAHNRLDSLGHVVMLSPPNKGSEVVDVLKNNLFFKWFLGPAGQELGTDRDSMPSNLKGVDHSVGIITGNKRAVFDGYFSRIIPGEDDGKVSVESAKLEGMADFLVTPSKHPFIMFDEEVIRQTLYFLENGCFHRD